MRLIGKVVTNAALAASVLGWGLLGALPANATIYDVTFTGLNFGLSAEITTANSLDALGGYNITGISGTVTGPIERSNYWSPEQPKSAQPGHLLCR